MGVMILVRMSTNPMDHIGKSSRSAEAEAALSLTCDVDHVFRVDDRVLQIIPGAGHAVVLAVCQLDLGLIPHLLLSIHASETALLHLMDWETKNAMTPKTLLVSLYAI